MDILNISYSCVWVFSTLVWRFGLYDMRMHILSKVFDYLNCLQCHQHYAIVVWLLRCCKWMRQDHDSCEGYFHNAGDSIDSWFKYLSALYIYMVRYIYINGNLHKHTLKRKRNCLLPLLESKKFLALKNICQNFIGIHWRKLKKVKPKNCNFLKLYYIRTYLR